MNSEISFREKDVLVMKLLHYFITEQGYNPIILRGVTDEIWLENMDAPYKIVRINTGYIHNEEQFDFDIFKTKKIMSKIKLKTFSLRMNALSLFLDLGDSVVLKSNENINCIQIKDESDVENSKILEETFPDIKDKLSFNEEGIELFAKITEDINKKNIKDAKEAEDVFKEKIPYITYILIAINVIMFILVSIFSAGKDNLEALVRFGALNKTLVVNNHEYYRLLTSAFLHLDIMHLFLNMYALFIIGKDIENYFGKIKYLLIYLFSALTGSLVSLVFLQSNIVSVGASGAIFGLMGALLYFGYHYRVMLNNAITRQIVPVILLNLFIGFLSTGINNFAHLGGLVGGLIVSMAVGVKYKSSKFEKINGLICTILFILFLIYMVFIKR